MLEGRPAQTGTGERTSPPACAAPRKTRQRRPLEVQIVNPGARIPADLLERYLRALAALIASAILAGSVRPEAAKGNPAPDSLRENADAALTGDIDPDTAEKIKAEIKALEIPAGLPPDLDDETWPPEPTGDPGGKDG